MILVNHLDHIISLINSNKSIHKIRGYCEAHLAEAETKVKAERLSLAAQIEKYGDIANEYEQLATSEIKKVVEGIIRDGKVEFNGISYAIKKVESNAKSNG